MHIPAQHIDKVTAQLHALTSESSDIYRFTKVLMRSPDISFDDKNRILKLKTKYVLARIEEITTGRDITPPAHVIQNPATLMSLGQLTAAMLSDIGKPEANA